MTEAEGLDRAHAAYWIRSKNKRPNQLMIERVVEQRYAEALLMEYQDQPNEQDRILDVIAALPWGGNRKRELLGMLSVRQRARAENADGLMARCLTSFGKLSQNGSLVELYQPVLVK